AAYRGPAPATAAGAAAARSAQQPGRELTAAKMKAPTAAASSNASAAADARAGSMRTSLRHNDAMRGLSQLEEFAMTHRPRPEPGVDVIDTPRYIVRIVASFPIPGPNSASFIRCGAEDVDEVIDGVEAVFAERNLPYNWIL